MEISLKKEENEVKREIKTSSSSDSAWNPISNRTNSASDGEYTEVKDFDTLLENAIQQTDGILRRLAED